MVNPTKNKDDFRCSCHRIASLEVNPGSGRKVCHFALKTKVKEIFQPVEVIKMFETDFHETNKDGQALSHDDMKFIKKVEEGRHRTDDRHYALPLPLKDERTMLPNNRELALSRIKKLKTEARLNVSERLPRIHDRDHREGLRRTCSAERVPLEELFLDNDRVWYIPHHGVYHPKKKTGKIRVVFYASAESKRRVPEQTSITRSGPYKQSDESVTPISKGA